MTGHTAIQQSLLKIFPFSADQLNQFESALQYSTLRRKEFLLQKGQISSALFFITQGSVRYFTRAEDVELTLNFYTENHWVTDLESFMTQQPSANFLEACEETCIAGISLQNIHRLMDIHPDFRMLNFLIANLTVPTAHLAALKTSNPDERYRDLLNKNPDWINRFPQHQIASYLGMTPETLSRVRSRL
jgi:CRP/FNR family transcriptional regulator, anaerobic regulatory protein